MKSIKLTPGPLYFGLIFSASMFFGSQSWAQTQEQVVHAKEEPPQISFTAPELAATVPSPRPEDVASPKAVVLALHASISGRLDVIDWNRFRSLFLPGARVGDAGIESNGKPQITFESVESFIHDASGAGADPGVFNQETVFKVHIEQFGNIANAFYSHSAVETQSGKTDDVRRVNSCQMLFDGKRWWIASAVWNESLKKWDLPADLEP